MKFRGDVQTLISTILLSSLHKTTPSKHHLKLTSEVQVLKAFSAYEQTLPEVLYLFLHSEA